MILLHTSKFTVIYNSNGHIAPSIANRCLSVLHAGVEQAGGELIAITWFPIRLAHHNIVWSEHRLAHVNLYKQILAGIKIASHDFIILAEHDVLYPLTYYHECMRLSDSNKLCYNRHVYHMTNRGYFKADQYNLLSNLSTNKILLTRGIGEKIREIAKNGDVGIAEPGNSDNIHTFNTTLPVVDIRHGRNLTGMREPPDKQYLATIPYWGEFSPWIA